MSTKFRFVFLEGGGGVDAATCHMYCWILSRYITLILSAEYRTTNARVKRHGRQRRSKVSTA